MAVSTRHIEPLLPSTGPQGITPPGIASGEAFGSAGLHGGIVVVIPPGIASAQAVGRPTVVRGTVVVTPAGITSREAFGTPTVTFGRTSPARQTLAPAGIPSQEALGRANVTQKTKPGIYPVGWAELELFGTPAIVLVPPPNRLTPSGIVSAAAFGQAFVRTTVRKPPPPRNYLIDRITREVYPWPVNHETEDAIKNLGRQLSRSGLNPGGFMIRQRTHPGPAHLVLHGHYVDQSSAEYRSFVRFFKEGDNRTFDYIDASGDSYHIQIVSFDAHRKRSVTHLNGSYFEYTLEVEVLEVNQGALAGHVS